MTGHHQIAGRREGEIGRQRLKRQKLNLFANVARPRSGQRHAPELAAREPCNERVSFPLLRAEGPTVGPLFVESKATSRLVLR